REAGALLRLRDGEPELRHVDAGVDEHLLEDRRLLHEGLVLVVRAEAHDSLDVGAIVPGPVEHDDLAGSRQVLDVALEVPLPLLDVRGLVERHDASGTRVEVLREPLDRPALARGIATLEHDDVLAPRVLTPVLELEELDLQAVLLQLVGLTVHALVVRVPFAPRLDRRAARIDEIRVRRVPVQNPVSLQIQTVDVLAQVLALSRMHLRHSRSPPPALQAVTVEAVHERLMNHTRRHSRSRSRRGTRNEASAGMTATAPSAIG